MCKKILITAILAFLSASIANAFYLNNDLLTVWQNRIDLQKAFPDKGEELVEWAKKYGWKENDTLFEFSPYYEMIAKIVDERLAAYEPQVNYYSKDVDLSNIYRKINSLDDRIDSLKGELKSNQPVVYTPPVGEYEDGEWRKCCGYAKATFYCLDDMNSECAGGSIDYEMIIWAKK